MLTREPEAGVAAPLSDGLTRPRPPKACPGAIPPAEWAGLGAVLILALAVRIGPIQRGLGFDELFTAIHFVETQTTWQTASTWLNFNNHIAYSLLGRLSESLFGRSEWALRLPALVLGLITVVLLWRLARPIVGGGQALAAAALLALSPEHVRWSTSARGYTGLVLGVLVMAGLLFSLLQRPRPATAVALAVVTALATYFHMYAALVAVVQGGFLLIMLVWRRDDPTTRRGAILGLLAMVGAGLLTLLLYLPVLGTILFTIQDSGHGPFSPDLAWIVAQEQTAATGELGVWLVLAVAGIGVARIGRTHPLLAVYAVAIAVVPVAVVILSRPIDQFARYFSYVLPFLFTALVAGATAPVPPLRRALPARFHLLAWAPAALGLALLLQSWSITYFDYQVDEGFRDAVQALEAGADDSAGLCAIGAGAELFQWYAGRSLALPKTVNELQQAARRTSEFRCVHRRASWESRSSAGLRRYVEERSTAETFADVTLYRMRRSQ
jgi:mannosyltransferase